MVCRKRGVSSGDYTKHLSCVRKALELLRKANLKVNVAKSLFATQSIKYLGYLVTTEGIKPLADKVAAIQRMERPKTLRQLRSFLGMVNYYRDMWKKRSHILAPLTALTKGGVSSRKAKNTVLNWTKECDEAFAQIKDAISEETLLAFLDFNKTFEIHTNASDYQLGGVVSQESRPIAFYSRKLNPAQKGYTTGEKEMLSVVEMLKEY